MNRKLLPITLITLLVLLLSVGGAAGQGPGPEERTEPPAADAQPQGAASIAATVNSRISYQGLLAENGNPVTGIRDMTFRFYGDDACTTQVGSDIVKSSVQVMEGLFSVELDVPQDDFNGQGLWLQVEVGGTAIGCREILPAPYALSLRPGAHIVGEGAGSATLAVRNHSSDDYSTGLSAYNLADSGITVGVWGQTSSSTDSARGVLGVATASSGATRGVIGRSDSSTDGAIGVHGWASATSGVTRGVAGRSDSSTDGAMGVYGYASATSGKTYGVGGHSDSTSGQGVYGQASATSGETYGVYGRTNSSCTPPFCVNESPSGVFGYASAISGANFGVRGLSDSISGQGVYGRASATSGTTKGVSGISDSVSGQGVYGQGGTYGLFGAATRSCTGEFPPSIYGVYGTVAGSSSGCATVGVYGEAATGVRGHGTNGYGVRGTGSTGGVYGMSNTSYGRGVFGYASATLGTTYGVYGKSDSASGTSYGGYFVGFSGLYGEATSDYGYAAVLVGNVAVQDSDHNTIIELGEGLDYAEGFDVSDATGIAPGAVLVIDPDHPGELMMSATPYDPKVAGIVAGAQGLGSGVRLGSEQFDYDVALAGRVYCNVDATQAGVEPGDLLTTSATPGYAMKVTDYAQAYGAILGKAMERLDKGERGQILVLVTLQ